MLTARSLTSQVDVDVRGVEEAAEVAWAVASPHQYEYLVVERGWSSEKYRAHLEATITSRLLSAGSGRGRAAKDNAKKCSRG
jgi:hypothetical protein